MMGLQAAASSNNKRKYEDTSATSTDDNGTSTTCSSSRTIPEEVSGQCSSSPAVENQYPNGQSASPAEDGASPCKNPRLEEPIAVEQTEQSTREAKESSPTTAMPISSSSTSSSITTTSVVASPLIAGAPTTIPINSPLLLPPAPPAEDSIAKLEAVAVPGETGWNCEPIVDPISKLQAVAVPGETWGSDSTRSTLATTLLAADDLDDDDDDFEDDFDDDETILPSYSPIRYPCSPNRAYIPAYPKPGYFPEPYQNCSRMNGANNGAQQYANRGYGWSQHGYYSPPYEAPSSQQTIRCAENGKSYFELGSANYSNVNQFGAQGRHLKRCCDGRNMSCNNKQCYKERRLKMMNLSMFKLARFRQASDQSLYRSVLICNTLKSIEREIDNENKEFSHQQHLQQQQHPHLYHAPPPPPHHLHHPHPPPPPPPQTPPQQGQNEYGPLYNGRIGASDKQQAPKFSDISNSGSSNYSRLQGSNTTTQSSPGYGPSATEQQPTTITTQLSPYDQQPPPQQQQQQQHHLSPMTTASTTTGPASISPHHNHPLKDPQSGRATPFPSSVAGSGSSSLTNGYHDGDSGFGDDDCTRPINWGSVLSLSSQSALDPLNNNDLFVTSPSVAVSVVNDSHHTANVTVLASNDNCDSSTSLALSQSGSSSSCLAGSDGSTVSSVSNSDSSSDNNHTTDSTNPASSSSGANSSSTTTLTSLTTLTTSSHCDLNLTTLTTSPSPLLSSCASALQYHSSTNGSNWDLAYLDMDMDEMFPNCYKITSFNSDVDMLGLKSPMLEPSKVVCDNDMDSFTTHIMVGS
ncbi:uncharacterized protein tara [Ochlerotatus camptorhynchus]|uniref:uncharacterized protein tara n=1 Tax=Ochlerotatus camptorhynchus TaxID=644619 RepID=UPI0031D2C071